MFEVLHTPYISPSIKEVVLNFSKLNYVAVKARILVSSGKHVSCCYETCLPGLYHLALKTNCLNLHI